MAENRTILLSVELDTSKLEKAAKDAAADIVKLKDQQKGLDRTTAEGQLEYKKLAVEITKTNKTLTQSVKAMKAAEIGLRMVNITRFKEKARKVRSLLKQCLN